MPQYANEAEAIRNLQTYLRQLSYHDASISPPPVDGIFDTDTQKSLTEFQISRGLAPTGIADQAVWELLYALYRASLAENTAPLKMDVFPSHPKNMEYGPGAQGFAVSAVQYMLGELERNYGAIRPPLVSGIYDGATVLAVKEFQKQNALQASGLVDRVTWNEIVDQYNRLFGQFRQY